MKKTALVIILFLAAGLLVLQKAQAQGTLYVSNLGQAFQNITVGSDSWLAQPFSTGTNSGGYLLNSVQLAMGGATGSPNGFAISIYSRSNISPFFPPMNSVGSLNGPDPASGGLLTYMTSGIMLLPSTLYFVVVTAATPVAQGAYNWRGSLIATGGDGWIIESDYDSSSDGLNWQQIRPNPLSIAIYATAIPEPSPVSLLFLGTGILFYVRRKT
jgi:hypothetical protein